MTAPPENPFAASEVGALYARGRPYHHPRTLARVLAHAGPAPVARGLDVACGTGMSTRALAEIATDVVGLDVSPQMLGAVSQLANTSFVLAGAEQLPFDAQVFDAVTCSSGVHWFDQARVYAELRRVLRPGGWVGLYDHYFFTMEGVDAFGDWVRELFARYPLPPRNPQVGDPATMMPDGFELVADETFDDPIAMTNDEFVDYQITVSHCVAAVERGTPRDDVRAWLAASTAPLFGNEPARVFRFIASVRVLRRLP